MKIQIKKAGGLAFCRGLQCEKLPEYINNSGRHPRIKAGTICAAITVRSAGGVQTSFYCRDCIDKLYLDIKTLLNSKLWIFN